MLSPKITIITPSFNQAPYIEKSIQSVIAQTYQNVEYIIIDGGSTDDTVNIIKKYNSDITYWESEPDRGIYHAMNKGIEKATGDWLFFLGTDDALKDNTVLEDLSKHMTDGVKVIYGKYQNLANNSVKGESLNLQTFLEQNICHQTIFFHKSLFKEFGLYNEKYKILADAEFNMRWFSSPRIKSEFTDRVIANYGAAGISSTTFDNEYYKDYYKLVKKYFHISKINKLNAPLHLKLAFHFFDKKKHLSIKHGWFYFLSKKNTKSFRSFLFILRKNIKKTLYDNF